MLKCSSKEDRSSFFPVCRKIVYQWVTTNCSFMIDITYADYDTVTSNQIFVTQFKHSKLFLTPA